MKIFVKFRNGLWAVLQSFGPWGVFLMAAMDGAGVPLPGAVDAVLVSYVYADPARGLLFALLASCGSALGCLVLYLIGYWGGEMVLERRMSPVKFEKIRKDFDNHPFIALAVPSLLPPPFPFKIVVLAAGAFEMRWTQFLAAILAGRLIRFGALAMLTIKFGPKAIAVFNTAVRRHPLASVAVVAVAVIAILLIRRTRRPLLELLHK